MAFMTSLQFHLSPNNLFNQLFIRVVLLHNTLRTAKSTSKEVALYNI